MAIIKTPAHLSDERINEMIEEAAKNMRQTYANKSGDEYKMAGDITKSPHYESIERLVVGLKTLRKFPSSEAADIKQMFDTLHRPIWGKMVKEYLAGPTEKNTVYTFYFTTGYRILRGELARIYSSTEATEKGVTYKFDKFARKEFILRFIRRYNDRMDEMIEREINENIEVKARLAANKTVQESAFQESTIEDYARDTVGLASLIFGFVGGIFKFAAELNPISFVSALLSRTYDKKVEKFDEVAELYLATVQSYNDYMKRPEEQRSSKIENKYLKNMEKYNIKMNNLQAKIAHYDQRAIDEADAKIKKSKKKDSTPKTVDKGPSTSSSDNDGFDF